MLAKRHIPNLLTFARAAAVPVSLVLIYALPHPAMALFVIFIAAALTDFLDGYLARKWNAISPLGAMLDPVADKLLVALLLIYVLTVLKGALFLPVVVILLRELYISGLREFLASRSASLPVSKGGKLKTTLQMLALALLLGRLAFNPPDALLFPCNLVHDMQGVMVTSCINQPWLLRLAEQGGVPLLDAAALVTLLTALHYTYAARKFLR